MIVILNKEMSLNPSGIKREEFEKGDSVNMPDDIAKKMISDGRASDPAQVQIKSESVEAPVETVEVPATAVAEPEQEKKKAGRPKKV